MNWGKKLFIRQAARTLQRQLCPSFLAFLWVTWTFFKIPTLLIYNITECIILYIFLSGFSGITIYTCALLQSTSINTLSLQVKCGNWTSKSLPASLLNTIVLTIRWCYNFCFNHYIWLIKLMRIVLLYVLIFLLFLYFFFLLS